MEEPQSPMRPNKGKLSKVLLSLLLVIPSGILIYFPALYLALVFFGFEFQPQSIFDYLVFYSLFGSAILLAFLPTAFIVSRIYQNKKIFLVVLLVFIVLLLGLAASIAGGLNYRKETVTKEIESAKASLQTYEPTYLPVGAELYHRTARGGKNYVTNYRIGENTENLFDIIQTININDPAAFHTYKCMVGINTDYCVEGAIKEEIEINGQKAIYYMTVPTQTGWVLKELVWKEKDTFIKISTSSTSFEKEDLIKIAESMKPVD